MKFLVFVFLSILSFQGTAGTLTPTQEYRYCGTPVRDKHGLIDRRPDVLVAFRKLYPCPATGQSKGPCNGWAIDHVIPLAVGGCDAVYNLQWLPNTLKSCKKMCKDRWERTVYKKKEGK